MSGKNFKRVRDKFGRSKIRIKKPPKTLRQWLTSQLRRISMRWPPKHEVLNAAKVWVDIGEFKNGNTKMGLFFTCAECTRQGLTTLHPKSNIQVDHITEIAGLDGFTDWDTYINALFCEADKLQVLCLDHHKEKTNKYVKKLDKVRKRD